jgi:protein SCO1/2
MPKPTQRQALPVKAADQAGVYWTNKDPSEKVFFRKRIIAATLAACAMALAGASGAAARTVTIGGPFALTAADGAAVTDADFRGRWLLVSFGYTFCPDICPTTLATVAQALDLLGPDAARLQPVFITVDPARDTPEVMGAYTAAFDARIVGLTGSPERIAAVAKSYGAHFETHAAGPDDRFYAVDHTSRLYVMDPDGAFVRAIAYHETSESIAGTLREIMNRN